MAGRSRRVVLRPALRGDSTVVRVEVLAPSGNCVQRNTSQALFATSCSNDTDCGAGFRCEAGTKLVASPAVLYFDNVTWNTPQTVALTALDDSLDEGGLHPALVTHRATSPDPRYNGAEVCALQDYWVSLYTGQLTVQAAKSLDSSGELRRRSGNAMV